MRKIILITLLLALPLVCFGQDAQSKFKAIVKELDSFIQETEPDAKIMQTDKTFEVEFDTMTYTVHLGSKTRGGYLAQTRQEIGPKLNGFMIYLSLSALNPIAAVSGQTRQMPYWQEYFWAGYANDREYVHFILKFGSGAKEDFINQVIRIVTGKKEQFR